MKIFILGAGEVGFHIASSLAREGHDLVIVEQDLDRVRFLQRSLDVLAVQGDGCDPALLKHHGVSQASLFFAVSNDDAANALAVLTARELGAQTCVVRAGGAIYRENPLLLKDEQIILLHPERLVAEELSGLTRIPGASKARFFEDRRLVMVQVRPARTAEHLFDKKLKDLDWPTGWVLAGLRRGTELRIPHGDTVIRRGETFYLVGRTDSADTIMSYLGISTEQTRRVVVGGAGQVGAWLMRLLVDEGVQVTAIEQDEQAAAAVAGDVGKALVLQGDCTDPAILREAGVHEADYYVSATQDDMTNVVSSLLARELGAHTTVALYNRKEFLNVLRAAHIDLPVSPRLVIAGTILRMVHRREILTLDLVAGGKAEVVEFEVPEGAKILSKPLAESRVPRGAVVGAVVRGEDIHVPNGTFEFQVGDHVLLFSLAKSLPSLEKLFHAR